MTQRSRGNAHAKDPRRASTKEMERREAKKKRIVKVRGVHLRRKRSTKADSVDADAKVDADADAKVETNALYTRW